MAEIARAGILSVDSGQQEAASAIGMSRRLAMWRIVLPQAMRVIVPPTGNEFIGMTKDTTLMSALPVSAELFFQLSAIGNRTYKIFAVDVAAILWYLIIGSVLMYAQSHLERHFGRGFGAKKPPAKKPGIVSRLRGIGATGGTR
jgi:polar amino acid transport system permease protein